MDIRQLIASKPKLGQHADLRFAILHNLRTLQQHEPAVAACLKDHGPLTVKTRQNHYEFSLKDERVEVIIRSGSASEAVPFQEVPHPLQLFCNEASLLHKNQLQFLGLTEAELRQLKEDFLGLARDDCLFVVKGRFMLKLHRQDDRLCFDPYP